MKSLEEWLSWQESLHPEEIELGLDRIRRVAQRLGVIDPEPAVITVAGTNGKGSSIAILESIALSGGLRVGAYTSPHLLRYNERIRINGVAVDDQLLCEAFERVDRARQEDSLTYFEFGTLAALDLFRQQPLDLLILEVGLGGRLDAVNLVDADVSLLTTVDLDHQEWLGEDRESIGREKAGIFRPGRPAIIGESNPPQSVLAYAEKLGAPLFCADQHFSWVQHGTEWHWRGAAGKRLESLPLPALSGPIQLRNSAVALAVFQQLGWLPRLEGEAIQRGLQQVTLPGRFQRIRQHPEVVVDVSHNPQAAAVLAENLASRPVQGRTIAVVAMLQDKEMDAVIECVAPQVEQWVGAGLSGGRGATSKEMEAVLHTAVGEDRVKMEESVAQAWQRALAFAEKEDRIVVFGSFYTVAVVLSCP